MTVVETPSELDKRHIETDIDLAMAEAVALFRAEYVLHNSMVDTTLDAEVRAKREPFLRLAIKLTRAELESRLKLIHERLDQWMKL